MRGRGPTEFALAFALATFQTCILVFALVALLYLTGDLARLLGESSGALGSLLFLLLWLLTFYASSRALAEANLTPDALPLDGMIVGGLKWGGFTGAGFWALLVGFGLGGESLASIGRGHPEDVLGFGLIGLFLVAFGGVFAAAAGAVIGLIAVAIEVPLVLIAQAITAWERTDAPAE